MDNNIIYTIYIYWFTIYCIYTIYCYTIHINGYQSLWIGAIIGDTHIFSGKNDGGSSGFARIDDAVVEISSVPDITMI